MAEQDTALKAPAEPVDSALTSGVETLIDKINVPEPLQPFANVLGASPWVRAAAVLAVFMLLAKIVEWILVPLLRRLTSGANAERGNTVVGLIRRPLFWSILLMGVLTAASVAGVDAKVRGVLISIALSIVIVLWTLFAIRAAKSLLASSSRRAAAHAVVRPQTLPLFTNLAAIVIFAIGIYFVFNAWHIDMTAWLASAGIVGIAVGFAAKDTLANLFSGVFIMADSPYKIGDYIVLDGHGGLRGKVTHIGIRSTRLLTRDDVEVTIPNSIMGNTQVVNESGGPHEKYRIRVAVGVAYGSDVDRVRAVLMDVASESDVVCANPVPRVRFRAFGASSLDFELLCWVDQPELRGRVLDTLNTAVYKRFIVEGIEIPYAKQDLYIKEMPSANQ